MSNSPALDALTNKIAAEDTVIDSAITLLGGLSARVRALPPNEAAIAQLANDIDAKTQQLSAAVLANTPTDPAPVVAPVEEPSTTGAPSTDSKSGTV